MTQQQTVLPDPPIILPPRVEPRYPATIGEILALAAELSAAGFDPGPQVKAAHDILHAIATTANQVGISHHYDAGLLDLSPAAVAEKVRRAGVESASQQATANVSREFIDRLALDIVAALRDASDQMIEQMRPEFTAALAVVRAAADAGIESTTDAASIVDTGNGKQLQAFRALPDAVRTLDQLGGLRDQLTQMCDVGPYDYPSAAWLARGTTLLDIEGAHNLHDLTAMVPIRTATYSTFARRTVERTGGRWLALVAAGFSLHINTGAEAHALVAAAIAADAETEADKDQPS